MYIYIYIYIICICTYVCVYIYIYNEYVHALLLLSHFSRVRLCNPIDGSPPGSPIPGILQARTLEWVAIAFSTCIYLCWCLYKGQRKKYICRERVLIDDHLSLPTLSAIGELIVLFTASYTLFSLLFSISYEIKRRLLLGRKVMTNLDSILKSRDITLPTKVRLVKAMVFPVVMYGCERWTVKKAER